MKIVTEDKTIEKLQYWKNPEDNVVYEGYQVPSSEYGFKEMQPIYSINQHISNVKLAK